MFLPGFGKKMRRVFLPLVFTIGLFGCSSSKDNSSPTSPTPNPPLEQGDYTNSQGFVDVQVYGNEFRVFVSDERGEGLEGILINSGKTGNSFAFVATDPSHGCFSNVVYADFSNENSSLSSFYEDVNIVLKGGGGDFFIERKRVDHSSDIIDFVATIPLSQLYEYYCDNDFLLQSASLLEFAGDVSGIKGLQVASKLNEYRDSFLRDYSNMEDIVGEVTYFFDSDFDSRAYYLDIYVESNLGVLTHRENDEGFCTLKGNVVDWHGDPLYGAKVEIPFWNLVEFADNYGDYIFYFLKSGGYNITASMSEYEPVTTYKIIPYNPPYYHMNYLNFELDLENNNPVLETLVLQPGPSDGKDAMISLRGESQYSDDNYANSGNFFVSYEIDYWSGITTENKFLIQIDNIPSYLEIVSARLGLYGINSDNDNFSKSNVQVKRITQYWREDEVTWNNQPNFNSYVWDVKTPSPNYGWTYFDITDLVIGWGEGTYSNYGVILSVQSDNYNQFYQGYTSENFSNNNPKMPKLEIVYEN